MRICCRIMIQSEVCWCLIIKTMKNRLQIIDLFFNFPKNLKIRRIAIVFWMVKLNFTDILLQKMKCLTGHFIFGKQRLWVTTSKDNKSCNFVLVKGKPLKPYILKSNNTHEK